MMIVLKAQKEVKNATGFREQEYAFAIVKAVSYLHIYIYGRWTAFSRATLLLLQPLSYGAWYGQQIVVETIKHSTLTQENALTVERVTLTVYLIGFWMSVVVAIRKCSKWPCISIKSAFIVCAFQSHPIQVQVREWVIKKSRPNHAWTPFFFQKEHRIRIKSFQDIVAVLPDFLSFRSLFFLLLLLAVETMAFASIVLKRNDFSTRAINHKESLAANGSNETTNCLSFIVIWNGTRIVRKKRRRERVKELRQKETEKGGMKMVSIRCNYEPWAFSSEFTITTHIRCCVSSPKPMK